MLRRPSPSQKRTDVPLFDRGLPIQDGPLDPFLVTRIKLSGQEPDRWGLRDLRQTTGRRSRHRNEAEIQVGR